MSMKEGDIVWLTGLSKAANLNGSCGTVIGRRGERFLVALSDQRDQVAIKISWFYGCATGKHVCRRK
jgi:hypothetical protein